MELKFNRDIRVSKNYLWHERDHEFENRNTHERRSDSSYEAKLDVYEDRVKTWFLDFAERLVGKDMIDDGISPGDYVALSIAIAYIEGVEHYRQGKKPKDRESGKWFEASVKRMLPTADDEAIKMLLKSVRCGLFHTGFTTDRVYLSHDHYTQALELTEGKLQIDPARFVQLVLEDFDAYVRELRASPSGKNAKKFIKLWDERWENS